MSIDQWINETVAPVSDRFSEIIFYSIPIFDGVTLPLILIWLVSIALFSTFYFGFINFRYFKRGALIAFGRISHPEDAKAEGQISSFQALATTLSGTVGLGNIAGVAIAISIGGAGAVFWMVVMGFLSMTTKFLEASLGMQYRVKNKSGEMVGGPMYYLRDGLKEMGLPKFGIILAFLFSICAVGGAIGAGNMFQSNQAYQQILNVTGGAENSFFADKAWLFGLALAVLVGVVVIGGIKSIAATASKIVPVMGGLYLLSGIAFVALNITSLPDALYTIYYSAFSMEAGLGGLVGAIIQGVRRAVFSNEAGIGSAAITHAAAKTHFPVAQGMAGMMGAFIDTVVICLVTALVIILSGITLDGTMEGVSLTSRAFETMMPWYPPVLAFIVFLFAYSTMITWCYIGAKGIEFIFGDHYWIDLLYKLFFCGMVIIGASTSLNVLLDLSDAMYFTMAIPNIIGLYFLAPKIKRELKIYLQHIDKK